MIEKQQVWNMFWKQSNYRRQDMFRLAKELMKEDKLKRGFAFWVYEIIYDKFFGYQDTVSRRLLF